MRGLRGSYASQYEMDIENCLRWRSLPKPILLLHRIPTATPRSSEACPARWAPPKRHGLDELQPAPRGRRGGLGCGCHLAVRCYFAIISKLHGAALHGGDAKKL